MSDDKLRDQTIEHFLNNVQRLAAVASKDEVQSVMAVVARCTLEIGDALKQLSADIQHAQKILGTRLSELNDQLQRTQSEMSTASEAASNHTAALVRWTKVMAFATAFYAILTGGLLFVALLALFRSPH